MRYVGRLYAGSELCVGNRYTYIPTYTIIVSTQMYKAITYYGYNIIK